MHLLGPGDTKEVVEVHRVEVVDPQHHNVIEGVVLILVLQAVLVLGLDLAVVAVLLVLTVVAARDLELLIETEIMKTVQLMIEGLDLYHLPEKMLSVVILVRPLVLVKRLGIDLQPQMILLLVLTLSQGAQLAVLSLEVPHGIENIFE
jgi:hypothetical protein